MAMPLSPPSGRRFAVAPFRAQPTWAGTPAPPGCEDHDRYSSPTYLHVGNVEGEIFTLNSYGAVRDAGARLNDGITPRGTNYYSRYSNTYVFAYDMMQAVHYREYCLYGVYRHGNDQNGYYDPNYVLFYGCYSGW